MSKKISKGDVVLAKDLTEDYWGSEIEYERVKGVKTTLVLKKHQAVHATTLVELFPEEAPPNYCVFANHDTKVTILTPPWARYPERPRRMGTIIQVDGDSTRTYVVDYYGNIISLMNAGYVSWDSLKSTAIRNGWGVRAYDPPAFGEEEA